MRQLGTIITTSGEHKINIAATKPAALWVEEGGALTFGDATFSQIIMGKGTAGAAEKHSELQRQITVTESKEKALQKEFDKLKGVSGDTLKIAAGFENAGTKIKSVSDKVGSIGKGMQEGGI